MTEIEEMTELFSLTSHEIEMMDKVFQAEYMATTQGQVTTRDNLAKFYMTTKEQIDFAYQNIGHLMGDMATPICTIQKFPSGAIHIVKFNPILYKRYVDDGGFKSYLERKRVLNKGTNAPTMAQITIKDILVGLLIGGTLLMIGWWVVYHNNWLTK